jgi:integrase
MGLTRRKDSYYVEFRVLDNGKTLSLTPHGQGKLKRWKVGCLNKGEAKTQEALIRTRLLTGHEPSPSAVRMESITFRQWVARYISLEEVRRLSSYGTLKIQARTLVDFFGEKRLDDIKPEDLRLFRDQRVKYHTVRCGNAQCGNRYVRRKKCGLCGWERTEAGEPASVQTINHEHRLFCTMMKVARSEAFRLTTLNPSEWMKRPNPNNERDRIATPEEWALLKQHGSPSLVRFLTIAYDLGTRRGELLKLDWPDVDMKRREFTLRHTKNREPRVIPMTDEVYAAFKDLWQGRRLNTKAVFLWRGHCVTRVQTAFAAACRRAGLVCGRKHGGLTVHDFRHTASTNFRRAGVDTMTAMKIVGHKSEKMHRRYNQITPDDLRQATAKLAAYSNRNANTTGSVRESGANAC